MSFIEQQDTHAILVVDVTQEESQQMEKVIEEEMGLMNYITLFPSRKSPQHSVMFLQPGMGCGGGRWSNDYLPRIKEMFPDRIVFSGEFES